MQVKLSHLNYGNDTKIGKKCLNKLELLALDHLMDEDVTFFD